MKKILIFLFLVSICLMINTSKEENVKIPNNAIRYRIIANSSDFKDQEQKLMINSEIEPIFADILGSSNTIDESRNNIIKNISGIEKIIDKYNIDYSVDYGINFFPEKNYKGVTYSEGNYESLVITLGEGLGENWWCVLFPPLCLLEAYESQVDDVTYSFYIKDIINRYS